MTGLQRPFKDNACCWPSASYPFLRLRQRWFGLAFFPQNYFIHFLTHELFHIGHGNSLGYAKEDPLESVGRIKGVLP
jgi:hypothetical protein